jgi:hypothetical protein
MKTILIHFSFFIFFQLPYCFFSVKKATSMQLQLLQLVLLTCGGSGSLSTCNGVLNIEMVITPNINYEFFFKFCPVWDLSTIAKRKYL